MGSESQLEVGGRELVESLLPHRPPFLYVERILERDAEHVVVERTVRDDEAWVAGHYPGDPILPGVLMVEMCFQAGAILLADPDGEAAGTPVATRITEARFKRMVRPGAVLRAHVTLEESVANARYLKGRVEADGKTAVTLKLAVALAPPGAQG